MPIRWPAQFDPSRTGVYVVNEIDIPAASEIVWAWLVRAQLWPTWYPNSRSVKFLEGAPPDLAPATRFRWWTFGVTITSVVREFEPYERLAWDAKAFGIRAYHAWLITRTANGCHVLTEETQHGFLARLGSLLMPKRMHHHHQIWLEQMREKATGGLPPRA